MFLFIVGFILLVYFKIVTIILIIFYVVVTSSNFIQIDLIEPLVDLIFVDNLSIFAMAYFIPHLAFVLLPISCILNLPILVCTAVFHIFINCLYKKKSNHL